MTERPNARLCIFLKEGAEEATRFYAETIPDTHVDLVQPIGGDAKLVLFRVMNTHFMAMDGNPTFEPRPDHSISIATLDQEETDRIWGPCQKAEARGAAVGCAIALGCIGRSSQQP